MSRAGASGVFALDWTYIEIDGVRGLGPDAVRVGAALRMCAPMVRLDGRPHLLPLPENPDRRALRQRARQIAHRLTGTCDLPLALDGPADPGAQDIVLTDGAQVWHTQLVAHRDGWLLVLDALPGPGGRFYVVSVGDRPGARPGRDAVICFADDTLVATDQGPRPIDSLRAGDLVQTRDDGMQPVLWVGRTRLSGLALRRHPHLRPVRLRMGALGGVNPTEDLRLSPAHRVLVDGPRARALFNADEVLVSAGDLVGQDGITQDLALSGVTYMHLLLERHQVLFANGVPTESFHPALAPADMLRAHRRDLAQVAAFLPDCPDLYGAPARRCLSTGEAALLVA